MQISEIFFPQTKSKNEIQTLNFDSEMSDDHTSKERSQQEKKIKQNQLSQDCFPLETKGKESQGQICEDALSKSEKISQTKSGRELKQSSLSLDDTRESESSHCKRLKAIIVELQNKLVEKESDFEKKLTFMRQAFLQKQNRLWQQIKKLKQDYCKQKKQCHKYLEMLRFSLEGWGIQLKKTTFQLQEAVIQKPIPIKTKKIKEELMKSQEEAEAIIETIKMSTKIKVKQIQPVKTFLFQDNKVKLNENNLGVFRQYMKSTSTLGKQKTDFSIKITSSKSGFILIGIVIKKRGRQKSSFESGQAIAYHGKQCLIWSGPNQSKKQGCGFREGDLVTVSVDLMKNSIEWIVNGKSQAKSAIGLFRFEKLCPYVQMFHKNDAVQWIQ